MADETEILTDSTNENRDDCLMDVDRMTNEGLGGGIVTRDNGLIKKTTTDTMTEEESVKDELHRKLRSGKNGIKSSARDFEL